MLALMRDQIPVWRARLVFAAVLLVFSEWIVWQSPLDFSMLEWLGWAAVYVALAAVMLDLLVRLRVGEVFSLLLLAGVYGLLNATLISHIATRDLPFSLIVRPLAAQPLAFMGALAAYQMLTSGRATGPLDLGVTLAIGVMWGVWVRWFPVVSDDPVPLAARGDALGALGIALVALMTLATVLPANQPRYRAQWLLTPIEWALAGGVLLAALVIGVSNGAVGGLGSVIVLSLIGFMLVVLVMTLPMRAPESLLDTITPPRRPHLMAWLILVIGFLVAGAVGYSLPGSGDSSTQSDVLFGLLTGFGVVWPPAVSAVIGVRAFTQLSRQGM